MFLPAWKKMASPGALYVPSTCSIRGIISDPPPPAQAVLLLLQNVDTAPLSQTKAFYPKKENGKLASTRQVT